MKIQNGRGQSVNPFVLLSAFGKELALILVFTTLIAVLLTPVPGFQFWSSFRYSLSIGLSIFLLSRILKVIRGVTRLDWKISIIAIPLGTGLGILIGSIANGTSPVRLLTDHPNTLVLTLAISLVFGTIISYYFYSRGVIAETALALRQEALERAVYEQRLTEANIRMLQAQIEPHFLFNTLSNILSLIPDKPEKAEQMLENFTKYLRASLQSTRSNYVTLKEEIEMLLAYLDIQSVRMGARLRYTLEIPVELHHFRIPPLLIQPLAENAIQHGLEPSADGGELAIRARHEGRALVIEICDTGMGISPNSAHGVGLANVRARLEALYPRRAELLMLPNQPRGLRVRLTIPVDTVAGQPT